MGGWEEGYISVLVFSFFLPFYYLWVSYRHNKKIKKSIEQNKSKLQEQISKFLLFGVFSVGGGEEGGAWGILVFSNSRFSYLFIIFGSLTDVHAVWLLVEVFLCFRGLVEDVFGGHPDHLHYLHHLVELQRTTTFYLIMHSTTFW